MHEESTLRECFDATPDAVPEARHLLVQLVERDRPEASEIVDAVGLTVSEAVGNVVRHAYRDSPPGLVEISAQVQYGWLVVWVRDHGAGMASDTPEPGLGLGLQIMHALADTHVTRPPGGGIEVSLRFPCHAPAAASG